MRALQAKTSPELGEELSALRALPLLRWHVSIEAQRSLHLRLRHLQVIVALLALAELLIQRHYIGLEAAGHCEHSQRTPLGLVQAAKLFQCQRRFPKAQRAEGWS